MNGMQSINIMNISMINYSDFWAFDIPIYKEWLSDDNVRQSLEEAASKHGGLDDEHRKVLLEHVRSNNSFS